MTLSLANSVEEVEPGCSGCNTQSDSDSDSSSSFRFTHQDITDVKLKTGIPATTTSVVFKDSPNATYGDTINIHIGKAHINGKEFEKLSHHDIKIPSENNVAAITYQSPTATATGYAKSSIGFEFYRPVRDHYKLFIFLISAVVVLCLITTAAISVSTNNHSDSHATPSTSTSSTSSSSPPTPAEKHYIIKRGFWGARPPSNPPQPLQHPLVVLTITETRTATCSDLSKCFVAMQNLQNSHVGDEHLPDIRYNFVVGGDGNVYEGRGWWAQNERMDNSAEVAFMGDFSEQPPRELMTLTGLWLIDQGVKEGYLRDHVKVECSNRTGGFLCSEVGLWAGKVSGGGDKDSH